MQLRHIICAIPLLALSGVAFATLEYTAEVRRMTSSGITKRADVAQGFLRGSLPKSQPLEKRHTECTSGKFLCSHGTMCCKFSPSL